MKATASPHPRIPGSPGASMCGGPGYRVKSRTCFHTQDQRESPASTEGVQEAMANLGKREFKGKFDQLCQLLQRSRKMKTEIEFGDCVHC